MRRFSLKLFLAGLALALGLTGLWLGNRLPGLAAPLADPPWNSETRVNDTAVSSADLRSLPVLAAASTGSNVYALWLDPRNGDDDLYFARSINAGSSWETAARVNHDVPGTIQRMPDLASDGTTMLHAVWVDQRGGPNAVYYSRSSNGTAWSQEVQINDVLTSSAEYPAIGVYTNTICIVWQDFRNGTTDIYLSCSYNRGLTWTADQRLNGDAAGTANHSRPDVVVDSAGRIHVVWEDYRSGNSDIYYAYWNGTQWSHDTRIDRDPGSANQTRPSISVNGDNVMVTWKDSRNATEVYANISTNGGATWISNDQLIATAVGLLEGPISAFNQEGHFLAAWGVYSNTQYTVYFSRKTNILTSWNTETLTGSTVQKSAPTLAVNGNTPYVAWAEYADSDTNDILVTSHNGTSWSTPTAIDSPPEALQRLPALAVADNGRLYTGWSDNRAGLEYSLGAFYVAGSTDLGQSWGSNIRVSEAGHNVEHLALAAEGTTALHAVWSSRNGTNTAIYYDRSTNNGLTWNSDLQLASGTYDSGEVLTPHLAVQSGQVYAVWVNAARSGQYALYLARSTNSGVSWAYTGTAVITNALAIAHPVLALGDPGEVHLAWEEKRSATTAEWKICYARSTNYGQNWANRSCIDGTNNEFQQSHPTLGADTATGYVHVAWQDNRSGHNAVYHAASADRGLTWNAPEQINDQSTSNAARPSLTVVYDGQIYLTWEDDRMGDSDIFYSLTSDSGLTWSASGRVNNDAAGNMQLYPAAASNAAFASNTAFIVWQDFRRANWDLYATSLITLCAQPLSSVKLNSPTSINPGTEITVTMNITPASASTPISYTWVPQPASGQGSSAAHYSWDIPGSYIIHGTAANCGNTVAATKTINVLCSAPLTSIAISGPASVIVGQNPTFNIVVSPANANPLIAYHWSPSPNSGQNEAQAVYPGQYVGSYTITATATNCGGTFTASHTYLVTDTVFPAWTTFSPTDWVTATQSPTCSAKALDAHSGLDLYTAQYAISLNGGSSWSAWQAAWQPQRAAANTNYTFTVTPAFGQDSLSTQRNRIKFRVADMAGNLTESPVYTVPIDTAAPTNPTLVSANRPTGTWSTQPLFTANWSGATDASSGIAGYSYQLDSYSSQPADATIDALTTTASLTIPADGTWYFHIRAVDAAGNPAAATLHQGPYKLDTVPPAPPAIGGSDPVSQVLTDDTTIEMWWEFYSDVVPGSGVDEAGWSYEWSSSSTTTPDTTPDPIDHPYPNLYQTVSPALPNGNNHYFHLRVRDLAGNWSQTTHYGPFRIDATPPALFADHGSGGPGSDVLLTGLVFPPNITVTLSFTSTSGQPYILGDILSSYDGTFQAQVTLPITASQGSHGFIARAGTKQAATRFTVTPGLQIVPSVTSVRGGNWISFTLSSLNSSADLLLESDLWPRKGPIDLTTTTYITRLKVPAHTPSDTYAITATTFSGGVAVQRGRADFNVTQLSVVTRPITLTLSVTHAQINTNIHIAGNIDTNDCRVYHDDAPNGSWTLGVIDPATGKCGEPEYKLLLTTDPAQLTGHQTTSVLMDEPDTDDFSGNLLLHDGWFNAAANPQGPLWDVGTELATGSYYICLNTKLYEYDEHLTSTGGQAHMVWDREQFVSRNIICAPFTLDPRPYRTTGTVELREANGMPVTLDHYPQVVFHGETIGTVDGTHPIPVNQVFQPVSPSTKILVDLPEGSYTFDAFACGYYPKTGFRVSGRGNMGYNGLAMTPTPKNGPAALNVAATIDSYLADWGKVGPFLSLKEVAGAPAVNVTFTITFNSELEDVQKVTVTLGSQVKVLTASMPGDPDHWSVSFNMSELDPGELTLHVVPFGKYKIATCGVQNSEGPAFDVPVVIAAAPPWLKNPTWARTDPITYTDGVYSMSGHLVKDFGTGIDQLPIDKSISIDYLGSIENRLNADVIVTETFSSRDGSWVSKARYINEATVMCMSLGGSGGADCRHVKEIELTAIPTAGLIDTAASPSYPQNYNGEKTDLFRKDFGPWEVYNGLIASYWGVINVRLSINFGIQTYANVMPGLAADLGPEVTLTPGAQLNGTISLWVDILLGVASAGVDGSPSLCFSLPMSLHATGTPFTVDGPNVGFKITGRVWAEVLFWEASFGPFEILKTGDNCFISKNLAANTPPPSTLPAPALTTDGYGHVLGTWVHDTSNHPDQNQGVIYSAYYDGAAWSSPVPVAGNAGLLVNEPALAFADNELALAVYASNTPNATQPTTWTHVTQQLAAQKISYSLWDGNSWSASRVLTTTGSGPRGRVTLAGDPAHHRAMALWIHDASSGNTKKWEIEYSVYDALTGVWSPVAVVAAPPADNLDAEVDLAFDGTGKATAVWVRQTIAATGNAKDSPFNRNDLRTLVIATWDPALPEAQRWNVDSHPTGLPAGALTPDVVLDDENHPFLTYALYDKDRSITSTTGIGNNNWLGYAALSTATVQQKNGQSILATSWNAYTVPNVRGIERPRVIILPENQAALVYRGFGAPGTDAYNGVAMAATIDLLDMHYVASEPGPITAGNSWMHDAVVIRRQNGIGPRQATVIVLGTYNLGGAAPKAVMSGASLKNISMANDEVYATTIPVVADMAVTEEDLTVAETLPLSGTVVPVTLKVRNLGLGRNHQTVTVQLLQDADTLKEELIFTATVPAEMVFNGTYLVTGTWQARSGHHTLTARIIPALDDDSDGSNNETTLTVGVPEAPAGLNGSINFTELSAGLTWPSVPGAALSHYRIYRAEGNGEFTWIADTTDTWYRDPGIHWGPIYRYTVTAVSDADIESQQSAGLSLNTVINVYLPLVMRNR